MTTRPDEATSTIKTDGQSHFAKKADVAASLLTGEPIVALCGRKFRPSPNPTDPTCPTCQELLDHLPTGGQ